MPVSRRRVWGWGGRVVALLAAAALALIASLATVAPASALAKIKCKQSTGTAALDPIVHHNQPDAMTHVHEFFGNNAWLSKGNSANYSDLEGQGTNCVLPVDTAGYWVPELTYTATGQPVPVQAFTAYYRSYDHKDFGAGVPFPADTRLISTVHDWGCGQFSGVPIGPTFPNCTGQSGKPGHTLTAHVTFPSCWDGVAPAHSDSDVGDTQDTAHYAFAKRGVCPAGFPNKVIELRETIQYAYTGDGSDLTLSSDAMLGGAHGSSMHGDFWNAWVQTGLVKMVHDCITSKTSAYNHTECG